MRKGILVIFALVSGAAWGNGFQCSQGYYLDPNGQCQGCGDGRYYCPGDDLRHDCPDPSTHLPATYPDKFYGARVVKSGYYSDGNYKNHFNINRCIISVDLENERGQIYFTAMYNSTTNRYEDEFSYGYYAAYPGYYLTEIKACWAAAFYFDARPCPAGTYCPGAPRHKDCGGGYVQPEEFGLFTCGDNTYSETGADKCLACANGYGNRGTDRANHAGVAACLRLCPVGGGKLHVGGNSFNIWPDKSCSSPFLGLGFDDGKTCCVYLEVGQAVGAMHVTRGDGVYHTVN